MSNTNTPFQVEITPSTCRGSISLPASKSLSHRALICAGLADRQVSTLIGLSDSQDIQATMYNLKQMGVKFSSTAEDAPASSAVDELITPHPTKPLQTLQVTGINPLQIHHPLDLNANESGSTLRFFIPIAALGEEPVTFKGKPSLLSRPMGIYADLFLRQNLPFHQSGESIDFHGPLQGGLLEIPGNISSQFISGLLFALPYTSDGGAIAVIPPYESRSYVDLTLQMIEKFGIQIETPTKESYIIKPGQTYKACTLKIEGDYSQLAFFGVLSAISPPSASYGITIENISRNSLQGDRVILDFLQKAGASIQWNKEGNAVTITRQTLTPQIVDLADCPDLGPILCVLAAYTPGTTKLIHTSRLRYKESDRVAAMEEELKKWNVDITSDEDSITIQGKDSYQMPETVIIYGHNDHRIVMAMSVFGTAAKTPSIIKGANAIAKSYPDFFKDLAALGAKIKITEV